MGDENEMKGKGAVERGTWMLAPEKPSCSPEALGTTGTQHVVVTTTHCVGRQCRCQTASVTVAISSILHQSVIEPDG